MLILNFNFYFLFYKCFIFFKYSFINFYFLINNLILIIDFCYFYYNNSIFKNKYFFKNTNKNLAYSLKLKKNYFFFKQLIRHHKIVLKNNKYFSSNRLKFDKFIKLITLQTANFKKIIQYNLNKYFFYVYKLRKHLSKNFFLYKYIINKDWNFLLGKLISSFCWHFIPQKYWIRKSLLYFMREAKIRNFKKNKFKIFFKKKLKLFTNDVLFKKFYLNNFFYFKRVNVHLRDLKFLIKIKTTSKKKNALNLQFTRPYLFLNNKIRLRKFFPRFSVYKFYKKYSKIFRIIKKSRFKFRNIRNLVFKNLNFKKKKIFKFRYRKIFFRYKLRKKRYSYFLFKNLNLTPFIKISKKKIKKPFKRTRYILRRIHYKSKIKIFWFLFLKTRLRLRLLTRIRRKLMFKKLKINNFNRFNKYLLCNFFKNFDKRFFFFNIKRRRRLKKIIFHFFVNFIKTYKLKFKWKRKKANLLKLKHNSENFFFPNNLNKNFFNFFPYYWTRRKMFKIYTNFIFIFKNFLKLEKKIKFSNSFIYNKLKCPVYLTKNKLPFMFNKHGFLYMIEFMLPNNFFLRNVSNLKKNLYSFSYKNDLHRYILKRYAKKYSIRKLNVFRNYTKFKSSALQFFKKQNNTNFALIYLKHFNKFNNHKTNILNFSNQFSSLLAAKLTFLKRTFFENQLLSWTNYSYFDRDINIRRVRFKPGYMSLWRNARQAFQFSLNLKIKYQYKLTCFLIKYNKYVNIKTFLIAEMQLKNILIKTRLLPDYNVINLFFENKLIFVNNSMCYNPFFLTFVGDFIQLIVTYKYYILYKWFSNWELKKKIRLRRVSWRKMKSRRNTDDKQKSHLLPNWILFNKNAFNDVAKFLEVDYFSLSIIILFEPFLWSDINPHNFVDVKFGIINLYNWKYIT